jgi:HEAT repeat protein
MNDQIRRAVLALLVLSLLTPAVLAHGGSFRGPGGITPGSRFPVDPSPTTPGQKTPGPITPPDPGSGTGPITPPDLPSQPGTGPIDTPRAVPGSGGQTAPATPPGRAGPLPQGPGLEHWIFWWTLNRERILNLRALQASRLRSRTAKTSPHFMGESGGRNARNEAGGDGRAQIITALLAAAEDSNADVATGAIIALGKAGDPAAIPPLMKLVGKNSADASIPESAVLALGMIGESSLGVRTFLIEVASDRQQRVRTRAFAALGLGFLSDPGAIPALMTEYHGRHRSNDVPASALVALGLLGDEIIVPDLSAALSGRLNHRETDDQRRAFIATALGMIRSRAALPALDRALMDREVEVRRQAVLSIGALARPDDAQVVGHLLKLLGGERDSQTRAFAAVSLGEIGAPGAADALLYAYRKGDALVVPYAALGLALLARNSPADGLAERIVPFLRAELLERKNSDLRGALALATGIAGDREAVPALRKILTREGNPTLRGHAAMALGLIGAEEAIEDLRKALTDRADPDAQREIALALGLLGDREAAAILISLVKNGRSEYVRGSAAMAIGRLADPTIARQLVEVLSDKSSPATTRAFVAVALGFSLDRHDVPLLSRIGEHLNHRMVVAAVAEVLTFL